MEDVPNLNVILHQVKSGAIMEVMVCDLLTLNDATFAILTGKLPPWLHMFFSEEGYALSKINSELYAVERFQD